MSTLKRNLCKRCAKSSFSFLNIKCIHARKKLKDSSIAQAPFSTQNESWSVVFLPPNTFPGEVMLYFNVLLSKVESDSNTFSSPCAQHAFSLKQNPLPFRWDIYWPQVSKKGICIWITICTYPNTGILILSNK